MAWLVITIAKWCCCNVYCSEDEVDSKVVQYANKIMRLWWNFINPDCNNGFVVFMSWQQNKVHTAHLLNSACQRILAFVHNMSFIVRILDLLPIKNILIQKLIAFNQGCARDLSGRDRDETEMLGILSETRPRPRCSSSRDLGRDVWWKKLSTTKSTEL